MEDYAKSMFIAPIPAKTRKNASLTPKQMTMLRAQIGSLSWLSMNVRMDLSFGTHELSKRMANATIKDLQYSNHLIKKANERQNKITYRSLGKVEDLTVIGFSDASFKTDEKSTGGQMVLLGNRNTDQVTPILWRSKIIRKACRSSKDAELLSLGAVCDQAIHLGKQLEEILFNKKNGNRFKPVIFCDNAPTLESIVSSKLVERRYLRPDVDILKQFLENREIDQIRWIPDELQISDILTKDKPTKIGMLELMMYGRLKVVKNKENYVFHNSKDFVMVGKHLRSKIIKAKNAPIKKRRKGSLLAQQELDYLQKNGELLSENDVCWIRLQNEWEIDDSYIYRPA